MFLRRTFLITAVTIFGQIAQIATLAYMARHLEIADIASYGLLMSIVAIATSLGALRYEMAFGVTAEQRQHADVLSVVLIISVAAGALALLICLLVKGVAAGFQWPHTAIYDSSIPLGLITTSTILLEAIPILALRIKSDGALYIAQLSRPILISAIQLTLFAASGVNGYESLMWGVVVGQVLSIILFAATAGKLFRTIVSFVSIKGVRRAMVEHKSLAGGQALQQVFSRISLNALPIFLTWAYPSTLGGWYVIVNRILATPSQTIGKAVRVPVLAEAATLADDPSGLRRLHRNVTILLFLLSLLLFCPVLFFPSEILTITVGPKWSAAADFMRAICLFWWSSFLNIPSSSMVPVLERSAWYAKLEITHMVLRLLFLLVFGLLLKVPLLMVLLMSILAVLFNAYLILDVRAKIPAHMN